MMKKMLPIIIIAVVLLSIVLYYSFSNPLKNYSTENIEIKNKTIYLDSLSLKQKLAQMLVVSTNMNDEKVSRMNIGGIYFKGGKEKIYYKKEIKKFQSASKIPFFVTADLEGHWNPFSKFISFKAFSEIETDKEAYNEGKKHGQLLKELGFNLDFSPVAEIKDIVWKKRAFTGNISEISGKVREYVKGLQGQSIMACAKHYPGGSLSVKDPHIFIVKAKITEEDLKPFDAAIKQNVSSIMVGHPVVSGTVNSEGRPCTVSKKCISNLRKKFEGLIITDAISMLGLRKFYLLDKKRMYVDLINSGDDVILDFAVDPRQINSILNYLERKVKSGDIKEENIDDSVKRILKYKGFKVN